MADLKAWSDGVRKANSLQSSNFHIFPSKGYLMWVHTEGVCQRAIESYSINFPLLTIFLFAILDIPILGILFTLDPKFSESWGNKSSSAWLLYIIQSIKKN